MPSLRRFSLTKGHKYMDESMIDTALSVLKYNPNLKQINIRWARERCPNHLKQEGSYDIITGDFDTPLPLAKRLSTFTMAEPQSPQEKHVSGSYDLPSPIGNNDSARTWSREPSEFPKALMVVERGIPIVGPPFERRFKYTLDPRTFAGKVGRMKVVRMISS